MPIADGSWRLALVDEGVVDALADGLDAVLAEWLAAGVTEQLTAVIGAAESADDLADEIWEVAFDAQLLAALTPLRSRLYPAELVSAVREVVGGRQVIDVAFSLFEPPFVRQMLSGFCRGLVAAAVQLVIGAVDLELPDWAKAGAVIALRSAADALEAGTKVFEDEELRARDVYLAQLVETRARAAGERAVQTGQFVRLI